MAILKLIISFATAPNSAVATVATQKFNKLGFITTQFDDGSPGWEIAANYFRDNGFTYTDGCGNSIVYRGDLAINGSFDNPAYVTGQQLRTLVLRGWDIDNHSDLHGNPPASTDLTNLEVKLFNQAGYVFNGIVVPGSENGYMIAGKNLGYAYATAQSSETFDGLTGRHQIIPVALQALPEFMAITRDFSDDWDNVDTQNYYKTEMAKLFNGQRNHHIFGTHSWLDQSAILQGYKNVFTYIRSIAADRVLFCPAREAIEYRGMRACPMTQVLSGNVLTVSINTANLSARTRWQDISLNVTGGSIASVTADGFDSTSFNSSTGLVNGFKQKITWDGSTNPTPGDTLNVPHGRFYLQNV
jgi:hypothetical protein